MNSNSNTFVSVESNSFEMKNSEISNIKFENP